MNDMTPKAQGSTLSDALAATFDPGLDDGAFARRLASLVGSLTNAPRAFVVASDRLIEISGAARVPDEVTGFASGIAGSSERSARIQGDFAGAPIDLPEGGTASLIIQLPPGGTVAGALALERLTGLSALSQATHRNSEADALRRVIETVSDGASLEALAGALHEATDADYAAVAHVIDGSVTALAISGQPAATTRAALPDKLRHELPSVAKSATPAPGDFVATGAGGTYVVRVDTPRRNPALVDVVVKALAAGAYRHRAGKGGVRRLLKRVAVVAVLVGLAFVPIPNGQRIAASVSAVDERIVTAPFTGVLATIPVRENDPVVAGETILATFDVRDITQELIAAQADHAKALLERETARAGRDATALRNAELEAERLRAQIDLLESRRDSAQIRAPISGLVAGDGLGDLQGATLRQGETLLRILDPRALRLSLEVSDKDVGDLRDGSEGVFRPDYDPSRTYAAHVTSISPALSERDDIAVFTGRAEFDGAPDALSPGLRGVLAVDRAWKPVWQVVADAVRDWVLLRVWF